MPCYYRCPAHSTVATDHFLWLNATDAQNLDEYFLSHASIAGYGQYWAKKDSAEFDSHSVLVGMTQERWDNKPYSYFAQFEMEQRELASLPDIVDYFLKEPDIEVRGEYELVLVCMDLDDVFVWLEDMKEERKAARLREAERKLFGEEIEEEAKEDASCEKSLEIKQETKKENQEGANEEIKEKNDEETNQPLKEETKTSKPSFDWIANTHLVRLLKRCALVTSKLSSLPGDKINGKYYWSKITERRPDFTNGKCILLGMEPHEYANLLDYLGNQMEHTDMNKIKPWFKISEILPKVQYYVHPEGFDITDPDAILVCVEDWDLWRWIKEGVKFIAERGRLEAQIVG
jgi:hypothetical protein